MTLRQLRGRNVGKTNADGTPVKREVEALDDLNNPQFNGHGELMRESIAGDVHTYERDMLGRVKTLQSVDGMSQWVYDMLDQMPSRISK